MTTIVTKKRKCLRQTFIRLLTKFSTKSNNLLIIINAIYAYTQVLVKLIKIDKYVLTKLL